MFGKDKGIIFTVDIAFLTISLMTLLMFSVYAFSISLDSDKIIYSHDLTFNEANVFLSGINVNETYDNYDWYLCSKVPATNLPERQVCVGD